MTCNSSWTAPTITDFKNFFVRDFNYAPADDASNLDYVIDADITRSINEGVLNFNPNLGFNTQADATNAFMYLAAFNLVANIQNSTKGLSSQSKFPISSNSVGGVSVSYQIPDKYRTQPILSQYTQNGYGMKYLSLVMPFIIGRVTTATGTTTYT